MPASDTKYCPACRSYVVAFDPGGPSRRPNAKCPKCGALERHRFLALLLELHGPYLTTCDAILDVAPQPQVADVLRRLAGEAYIATDLFPVLDIDIRMDLTRMGFATDTFDVIVGYHVLEHIPEDKAAMRELSRVLKPGGLMFMQVPWNRTGNTEENPDADEEERLRRFGQKDHVRLYGQDMEGRLADNGLRPGRVWPSGVLTREQLTTFGIPKHGVMWILRKSEVYHLKAPPELQGLRPVAMPGGGVVSDTEVVPDEDDKQSPESDADPVPEEEQLVAREAATAGTKAEEWLRAAYHRMRTIQVVRPILDRMAHRYVTSARERDQ